MPAKAGDGISQTTVDAFNAMTGCLDGLYPDEARDAALNVLVRVIMCQAASLGNALDMADVAHKGIREIIKLNWRTLVEERAPYGGRHPLIGEN